MELPPGVMLIIHCPKCGSDETDLEIQAVGDFHYWCPRCEIKFDLYRNILGDDGEVIG